MVFITSTPEKSKANLQFAKNKRGNVQEQWTCALMTQISTFVKMVKKETKRETPSVKK